jgi:Na+/proline symporter
MDILSLVIIFTFIATVAGFALYAVKISGFISNTRRFFIHTGQLEAKELSYTFSASWMSLANVIAGLLILALIAGIANLWAVITWAVGFIVLSSHTSQIKKLANTQDTIHGFLARRYGISAMRSVASFITILSCLGIFALELIVGIALLQIIPGIKSVWLPVIGSVMLTVILAFYTSKGGYYAVIRTDRIQWILIVIAIISMFLLVVLHAVSNVSLVAQIPEYLWNPLSIDNINSLWGATGWSFVLGILFLQLFLQIGDMGSWQRIVSAKDTISVKKSLKKVSLWTAAIWVVIAGTGIMLWSHPNLDGLFPNPEAILATQAEPLPSLLNLGLVGNLFIGEFGGLLLVLLILVGLVSAMLSTADTYIVVIMQTLVKDIVFIKRKLRKDISDIKVLNFSRKYIYLIAFLGLMLFWILIPLGFDLLTLVFVIFGSQTVFAPLVVTALREDLSLEKYKVPALISCITGFIVVYILGYFAAREGQIQFAYWAPVAGVLIPFVILTVTGIALDRLSPLWLARSMLIGHYPQKNS